MDLTDAINRFRGPLVGLIASWGVPPIDATEIAQDSFASAYLNRDACRGDWEDPETFGRWLRGVARNKYRNWRRSRMRRERRIVSTDPAILEETIGKGQQEEDQRIVRLRTSIEQLSGKQRQVVMMHYLEETSVKEVAALLSVSVKTVEGRLYQARRALKRMMDDTSSASIGKALLL